MHGKGESLLAVVFRGAVRFVVFPFLFAARTGDALNRLQRESCSHGGSLGKMLSGHGAEIELTLNGYKQSMRDKHLLLETTEMLWSFYFAQLTPIGIV